MFCTNCGTEVSKLDNYCQHCGELVHGYSRIVKRWNTNQSPNPPGQFDSVENLKQKLLEEYGGKDFKEIIKGREVKNSQGSCFIIEDKKAISLKKIDAGRAKSKIASDLKLIYGIGKITETELKKEGYSNIYQLKAHPRFGKEAAELVKLLDSISADKVASWICRWVSKSHPLVFCCSAFSNIQDYIILDIETLGLYNKPIILIGMGKIKDGYIHTRQYLIRDLEEEAAILSHFITNIEKNNAFITFNGLMFDIPFLQERLYFYGIPFNLSRLNYDILHFSRRVWKHKFENYKLETLENLLLGVNRKMDLPSTYVPDFYRSYLSTKNIGPLIPIIEHNKQDIISLANLFAKISEEWETF